MNEYKIFLTKILCDRLKCVICIIIIMATPYKVNINSNSVITTKT